MVKKIIIKVSTVHVRYSFTLYSMNSNVYIAVI